MIKESIKEIGYNNYYDVLTEHMSDRTASYIIKLIQLQLLEDMIDNFTDVMKDIVEDLPRMEGKEYHDEKVKLDAYIEIVRDIVDTWSEKYSDVISMKNAVWRKVILMLTDKLIEEGW